jgi:DNA helicase HerA-like ATPase
MGKSTFMRRMLNNADRFIVTDPKGEFEMRGVPILAAVDPKLDRQIIRLPRLSPREKLAAWAGVVDAGHAMGNVIIYNDELTDMIPKGAKELPESLDWANRAGRSRNVAMWWGSQEPTFVPNTIFANCNHFFFFHLQLESHRRKAELMTMDGIAEEIEGLPVYDCLYLTRDPGATVMRKLIIRGRKRG